MELFLEQVINGLNAGSIYALIAIGYTMVYGIIRLINFAHGEIMMFGAYFAFLFATSFGEVYQIPLLVVILIAMVLAAIMGVLIEKVAYSKLRNAPRISALITAIGMSLLLQNLALKIFGSTPKVMPNPIPVNPIEIGLVSIPLLTVFTILMTVFFMILLTVFVNKTKQGRAMRAVSQDKEAAMLMGINVNNTISLTFAIGSALGALGGVFFY